MKDLAMVNDLIIRTPRKKQEPESADNNARLGFFVPCQAWGFIYKEGDYICREDKRGSAWSILKVDTGYGDSHTKNKRSLS